MWWEIELQYPSEFYSVSLRVKKPKHKYESINLNLNTKKSFKLLKWKPKWNLKISLKKTYKWYECYYKKKNINEFTYNQINNH